MKVYSLIYSKASPRKSPQGIKDFHAIFYPLELMNKDDIFALVQKIHFPGSELIEVKHTVFYQNIRNIPYLVILQTKNLPQDRDEFGRGGLFLVQGFIFPPEVWRNVPSPLSLLTLIKDFIFKDREEAFSSDFVDWETGDFKPIEIPDESLESLPVIFLSLNGEFEIKLSLLLNKLARNCGKKPALLFKGTPVEISNLLTRFIAYVPESLRVYLGWDSAFDRGNLNFYPLKIAGFSQYPPLGGNPINIDLETLKIEESQENTEWFRPETLYERWLYEFGVKIQNPAEIEEAYALSLLIEKGKRPEIDISKKIKEGFISVYKDRIEDAFFIACEKMFGSEIGAYVSGELSPSSKLELLIEGLPAEKLSNLLEIIILKRRLTPKSIKMPLPSDIKKNASQRLSLILKAFEETPLKTEDLDLLNKQEKEELISYLLLSGWKDKSWLLEILKKDEVLFNTIFENFETRMVIEKIVKNELSSKKEFSSLGYLLLREAKIQGKVFELFTGKIDPLEILDTSLKEARFSEKELKLLIKWAKKRRPQGTEPPFVKSFLYPEMGISYEILAKGDSKFLLLECLIKYQGYKPQELEVFGFKKEEILIAKEKQEGKGIFGQLKKLFDLKRTNSKT